MVIKKQKQKQKQTKKMWFIFVQMILMALFMLIYKILVKHQQIFVETPWALCFRSSRIVRHIVSTTKKAHVLQKIYSILN